MEIKCDKKYYIELIKKCGKHIFDNAESYLEDFDETHIREINFNIKITYDEIPTITLNKEYYPNEVF